MALRQAGSARIYTGKRILRLWGSELRAHPREYLAYGQSENIKTARLEERNLRIELEKIHVMKRQRGE